MRGETMKDKSKKSTYSTTFGVDPIFFIFTIKITSRMGFRVIFHIDQVSGNFLRLFLFVKSIKRL